VLGSITRFSIEQKQRSLGGAAIIVPFVGGFNRHQSQLVVGLSFRVVDVRTGEVVAGATGRGESVRSRVSFGGLGALRGGGAGGITSGSIEFRDAQLDEAVHLSVAAAADNLVHSASRLTRTSTMGSGDR
jgi:curli biogenesis system outer membrane secretion channel CsgG